MKFEKVVILSGRPLKYPNLRKMKVPIRFHQFRISLPRHSNNWLIETNMEKGIIKLKAEKRQGGIKTSRHIPISIIKSLGFRASDNIYEIYRYMPSKDLVFLFQKKRLIQEVRK